MQSKLIFTALLGASLAFAGCSAADKAKDAAAATADKAKDAAAATADKAKDAAAATKDAAAATADKAKDGVKTVADKSSELAADAKDTMKKAGDEAAGSGKKYSDKAAAKADEAAGSGKKYGDKVKKAGLAISTGTFSGRSDHVTTGKVALVKTPNGYRLNFAPDFSLDGAPDPIVAIGNGGVYEAANKIGVLKNKEGRQSYALPASFKPGEFSQVYVWCEKFNVPLGIADLTENKS